MKDIFFVKADSKSEASIITRNLPRVKHNHEDAILAVYEISYAEYIDGIRNSRENPYYICQSQQEQQLYWDIISQNIYEETETQINYRNRSNREVGEPSKNFNRYAGNKKIRNFRRYFKMNYIFDEKIFA